MGKTLRKFLCLPIKETEMKVCNILMLGLSGSGKTEIGHILCNEVREDYAATNGVRQFKRCYEKIAINISEIGGSLDMRKIWHHYYHKAMGLIYTIDVSDLSVISNAFLTLENVLRHRFAEGKPILVIITKLDRTDRYDLDIIETKLESIANKYKTSMLMVVSEINYYKEVSQGLEWLILKLKNNYKITAKRLKFEERVVEFEKNITELTNSQPVTNSNNIFRPFTAPQLGRSGHENDTKNKKKKQASKNVRLRWILVDENNKPIKVNNINMFDPTMTTNTATVTNYCQTETNKIDVGTSMSENQLLTLNQQNKQRTELCSGDDRIKSDTNLASGVQSTPITPANVSIYGSTVEASTSSANYKSSSTSAPSSSQFFHKKFFKNNRIGAINYDDSSPDSDASNHSTVV